MNFANRALHALKWQYMGTILRVGFQLMVGIALARLLSPEEFGLLGMALIVIGFGTLVVGAGFGVAIIQRPSVTKEHTKAAFTGSVIMGLALFAVVWFLAPAISRVFMEDSLTSVLRLIGMSFVFSGMSATPVGMLQRELRFRALAIIETLSYAVGYGVVGVSLAFLGYGVWSLVAANIVQALCLMVLAVRETKQPLWPHLHAREYCDLFRVAYAEVLNNITNYVAKNADSFVIGKWLGAPALGLYNRSVRLMRLPVKDFSGGLSRTMFPVFSKIQRDIPRLGRAFLRTVSLSAVITMPALFAMAAVPEIVIGGLYGEQWKAAAGAFQILCVSGPIIGITNVCAALSHSMGYLINEWPRRMIYLALKIVTLFLLLPYGIEGVALAVVLSTFVRYFLLAQLSLKLAAIPWRDFFLAQLPGALLGITVAVPVYLASGIRDMFMISDVGLLLLTIVIFLLSLTVTVLLIPPSWFGDLYPWVLERFGANLPKWPRQIMAAKLLKSEVA